LTWLTIREGAVVARRPVQTINRWIREGVVDSYRVGSRVYVDGAELLAAEAKLYQKRHAAALSADTPTLR
jgi:hypothetical protein